MLRSVVFTFLFAISASGFGQIDPAAKPFLANVAAVEPRVPVRALDYTLRFTSHEEGDETETCVRTALDFVEQRMLSRTRYGGETVMEIIYADGQVRMIDPIGGEPTVLPKGQAAVIKRIFRYSADLVRTGGALPEKILRATYDGVKSYGEVVRGEQLTAEVMAASFTLGNVAPRRTTMRFIFGDDKQLMPSPSDVAPQHLLYVLDNPTDPVPTRRMLNGSVYWLGDGKPVLSHTQRLARYRFNPKLSDKLFTSGNGAGARETLGQKRAPAKTPR